MQTLKKLQLFLENIDSYRDKALFVFINPYWPRKITPNHITYIRVLIGIILIIILFFFRIDGKSTILSLFIIGLVTDLIDGPIARGLGKVTEFGAMLDSASDRLLIMPIAIYSLLQYQKWLLFVLILTEILNGILPGKPSLVNVVCGVVLFTVIYLDCPVANPPTAKSVLCDWLI